MALFFADKTATAMTFCFVIASVIGIALTLRDLRVSFHQFETAATGSLGAAGETTIGEHWECRRT